MTAVCGGGASGPKAGIAETIIITTTWLASILNNKGGAWASIAVPLLGVLSYQATELCETDPPANPNITAADYAALLNPLDPAAFGTALGKLADLAKIAIWYEMCECKTVPTPAVSSVIFAPPTGLTLPVSSGPGACYQRSGTFLAQPFPGGIREADSWYAGLVPPGTQVTINEPDPTPDHAAWTVPAGVTSVRIRALISEAPPNTSANIGYVGWSSNGNPAVQSCQGGVTIDNIVGGGPYPEFAETTVTIPAGTLWHAVGVSSIAPEGTCFVDVSAEYFCGGTTSGSLSQPCAADPAVLALLTQIMDLLKLVQRQGVPFAYVPGPTFTPLTGNGEVTVQAPVAVNVVLETVPAHYGLVEGQPDRLFDVGYIALGTADGYQTPMRVTSSPFYVRTGGEITKIGYSFAPGVVASIQAHTREP